jgi:protocatechuate 3,4-dioxygenase beta subunit
MLSCVYNNDKDFSPRFCFSPGISIMLGIILSVLLSIPVIAGEQEEKEKKPSRKAVIAPADEPGERMIISGTVYAPDGKTPQEGIKIYVYHTDAEGYYSKEFNSSRNARLNGAMVSDSLGRYEYETIRPGPYPGGGIPAHVHYVVTLRDGVEKRFELLFEGDPNISDTMRHRGTVEGGYLSVRPLEKDENGIWVGKFDLILRD